MSGKDFARNDRVTFQSSADIYAWLVGWPCTLHFDGGSDWAWVIPDDDALLPETLDWSVPSELGVPVFLNDPDARREEYDNLINDGWWMRVEDLSRHITHLRTIADSHHVW